MSRRITLLTLLLVLTIVLVWPGNSDTRAQTDRQTDRRPETSVSPLPTPTTSALSSMAEIALRTIAQKAELSLASLHVTYEEDLYFPTMDRTYHYVVVLHLQEGHSQEFRVLVDPITGVAELDADKVRQDEQEAYLARYGKLNPELYSRLQKIMDGEKLPVALWVLSDVDEHQQGELVAEVAQLYPEAAEAYEKAGAPWAVDDPAMSEAIYKEYFARLDASAAQRVAPMMTKLKQQGHEARQFSGAPVVAVALTKDEIIKLAEDPLVQKLYLLEAESVPESGIATATSRLPSVWRQGYKGNGIRIAIVEGDLGGTNINTTADNCLNIIATRNANYPDMGHMSRVAAIAACNDDTLTGSAEEAQIIDGGFDDFDDPNNPFDGPHWGLNAALSWALQAPNAADIVNISWGVSVGTSTDRLLADAYADYWARHLWKTIVKSAGNTSSPNGTTVTSPGKAWNVLTVGNIDDSNTAAWADDAINGTSSFVDPSTGVEKPEVAAPGTRIETVVGGCSSGADDPCTGTSMAAPQVAGLAALMMQQHNDLRVWPSAVKAIVMASAVHNVEGTGEAGRRLSERDGAGSINATLAVSTADIRETGTDCRQPCWWGIQGSQSLPTPNGGFIDRYIWATRGERIRVVISWLAPLNAASLTTNYNLRLYEPGVNPNDVPPFVSSESTTNNFEIVEFVAPTTGRFRVRVIRQSNDDDNDNRVAIAWTKQATYLPDVRGSNSGWRSYITIRNDGAEPREVTVTYLDDSTNPTVIQMQPGTVTTVQPPASYSGAAVVDGSEDLSVVVEQVQGQQTSAYSGIQSGGSGDPNWGLVGTDLYLPYVYRAYPSSMNPNYNTDIALLNTGAANANVTLTYCPHTGGTNCQADNRTLTPGQRLVVQPNTGNNFYGSARIVSDQPLAVMADARNTNIDISNQASQGVMTAHLPYVMKGYYGWDSCFVMRNLSSNAQNMTVVYHWLTGSYTAQQWVNGNAMWTSCQKDLPSSVPNGGLSATITASAYPIAVAINQSHNVNGQHMSYNAGGQPTNTVVIPILMHEFQRDGRTWSSGFQVQNTGTGAIQPTVTFYGVGGTITPYPLPSIAPGKAVGISLRHLKDGNGNFVLAPNTSWFAVITANQPLIATANATCTSGCSGDTVYAYPAFNR